MHTEIIRRDARTDLDQAQLQKLRTAVYPPETSDPNDPGNYMTWAKSESSVVIRLSEGGDIVAHAGVLRRMCLHNNRPVLIGGIGGVQSHPDFRQQGLGRAILSQAVDVFRSEMRVDFGLLVCPERVIEFYRRLGWKDFTGTLLVEQPEGRIEFTANYVMVLPVLAEAPTSGTIDLLGLPW